MLYTRTGHRGRRWSRLVAAPLGAAVLVGLSACGASADPGAAAPPAGAAAPSGAPAARPSDDQMKALRDCFAQNGVTLPDPPNGGSAGGGGAPPTGLPQQPAAGAPDQAPPGVDATDEQWAAAQKACAGLAPAPLGGAPAAAGN